MINFRYIFFNQVQLETRIPKKVVMNYTSLVSGDSFSVGIGVIVSTGAPLE
jgi:hypothetical protein